MQHPCTFASLPDTPQPYSSQGPWMKVVVLGQVSHQPLAACQSDECVQSYTVLTTAVLCGAPTAISLSPLISLTCHQVQQGPHHPPCNDKSYRDLSHHSRKFQLNWITSKELNGQLTSQTVISGVFLAYQPRLPRQACAPGAWGPGLAGLGATRSQVGHPCMGAGWLGAAAPASGGRWTAPRPASVLLHSQRTELQGCRTQKFMCGSSIPLALCQSRRPRGGLAAP